MQPTEGGSLFEVRFQLRTLLYAVTAICLFLALCPLIATKGGFNAFVYVFLTFCFALTACAVWLATRNMPRYLGILIVCHLAIAVFLLIGPILSYHLNGCAWYDYGLSSWDPPVSQFSDGTLGIGDYDPKYTLPAVWPVIGPIMYYMCWLSIGLIIFPPTGPVVSIAYFVLAIRLRHVLTVRQSLLVWIAWAIGLPPVLYMIFWGGPVFEWIAD